MPSESSDEGRDISKWEYTSGWTSAMTLLVSENLLQTSCPEIMYVYMYVRIHVKIMYRYICIYVHIHIKIAFRTFSIWKPFLPPCYALAAVSMEFSCSLHQTADLQTATEYVSVVMSIHLDVYG